MGTHPDDNELVALAAGTLPAERRDALSLHLDVCHDCRMVLSQLTSGEPAALEAGALPAVGSRLGRSIVRSVLGQGGMGVVFECFDPELERRLAVKLLHRADSSVQVVDEARSLARVVHPNVISVFDVGTWNGRVFLAMELAEGGTLRTWASAQQRSLRELVDVLRPAARGLAAAHTAGLIHADVKPDNFLLGADGQPRLADFGLARSSSASGARGGTKGYLAPELRTQPGPTAQSDQFAFCVMAVELLTGTRPATSEDVVLRQVPTRVRSVLRRGLSTDPAARWPTMSALEQALRPPSRQRRAVAVSAVGLLVLVGLGRWHGNPCRGGPEEGTILSRTDDEALLARERANSGLSPLVTTLRHWRTDWTRARAQVCASARADERPVRLACLQRQFEEMQALTQTLLGNTDDARIVTNLALSSLVKQPAPVSCLDDAALRLHSQSPPTAPALAKSFSLVRARMFLQAPAPADSEFEALRAAAEASGGSAPLEGLELWALSAELRGDPGEAARRWKEAFTADEKQGDDVRAFDAAVKLVMTEAYLLGSVERAETWVTLAQGKLARIGEAPLRRADLESALAVLQLVKGDDARSAQHYLAALELRRGALGELHHLTLSSKSNLGLAYGRLGESERAFTLISEAVSASSQMYGQDTVLQQVAVANLAGIAADLERYEQELDFATRALALKRLRLGPGHRTEVEEELYRAEALAGLGRCDEATTLAADTEVRLRDQFPAPHFMLSWGLQLRGKVLLSCRQFPQAVEQFEAAAKLDGERGAATEVLDSHSWAAVAQWRAQKSEAAKSLAQLVVDSTERGLSRLTRARASFVLADLTWPADQTRSSALGHAALEVLRPLQRSGPELQAWLASHRLSDAPR